MALGCHSQYLPGQSLLQIPGHQFIEAFVWLWFQGHMVRAAGQAALWLTC
jgi:hypothetical protein